MSRWRVVGGRLLACFILLVFVIVVAYLVDTIYGVSSMVYNWLAYATGLSITKIETSDYVLYALYGLAVGSLIGIIVALVTAIRGE